MKFNFMTKGEGEIQKSLGLATTYKVRVLSLRKDVYVVCIGEHDVDAYSKEDAIEHVQETLYKGRTNIVFEVIT